ncbi:uncharacterized protein B0H18DRAFT_422091 [Fomitopsis serialis]|uniref:uncharacterized protein n=1 Tax=Fomitopsis serialis TaxID=139415 RepID=UPI002007A484|nr:uncharacterized protein B0H18DRAFT_422091 [Neoantrodia serialis]KAH9935744.1 hypothetical protein B0H18DRAFT_422091 [Neoantrodia serialis]
MRAWTPFSPAALRPPPHTYFPVSSPSCCTRSPTRRRRARGAQSSCVGARDALGIPCDAPYSLALHRRAARAAAHHPSATSAASTGKAGIGRSTADECTGRRRASAGLGPATRTSDRSPRRRSGLTVRSKRCRLNSTAFPRRCACFTVLSQLSYVMRVLRPWIVLRPFRVRARCFEVREGRGSGIERTWLWPAFLPSDFHSRAPTPRRTVQVCLCV